MVISVTVHTRPQEKVTKNTSLSDPYLLWTKPMQLQWNSIICSMYNATIHVSYNVIYTFQFLTYLCLQFPVLLRATVLDKQKRKDQLVLFGTFVPGQRHNLRFLHYLPPLASHGRSRFLRAPSPIASTPKLVRNVLIQLFIC